MEIPFSFDRNSLPAETSATISFTLDEKQEISLHIYNNHGQLIHTLFNGIVLRSGYHELQLYGEAFPDGASYARLQSRHGIQQQPLVVNTSIP